MTVASPVLVWLTLFSHIVSQNCLPVLSPAPSPALLGVAELSAALSPAERLAVLDMAAERFVREEQRANTVRGHESDWRAWTAYTAALGIPELSGTLGALVGYAKYLADLGKAPNTIERRLSGAVVGLRARGTEVQRATVTSARDTIDHYRHRLAVAGERLGRGKAPALAIDHLREVCRYPDAERPAVACPPGTLTGARDRSIVLLAFAIGGRRSEVAALRVADLEPDPRGLVVTVRYSKTTPRTVVIPYGQRRSTCPVRAWHAWRAALGERDAALLAGQEPAFRQIDRHGRVLGGLTGHSVGAILSRVTARAAELAERDDRNVPGLDRRFTGHSARSGMATAARAAGKTDREIEAQGGWTAGSRAVHEYMRITDRWTENAVLDIGL